MARRKKRKNHGGQWPSSQPIRHSPARHGPTRRLWLWLTASGVLLAAITLTLDYVTSGVRLSYVRPLGTAYEFELFNEGPFDRVVQRFRVTPKSEQEVIYKFTRSVLAEVENGQVVMPGGETSVPAAEFKELDGQTLPAKSGVKFRVPPLSNQPWLLPDAALIRITYSSHAANGPMQKVERLLEALSIREQHTAVDYLVLDNYWAPVRPGTLKDAITQACRESASLARSGACSRR